MADNIETDGEYEGRGEAEQHVPFGPGHVEPDDRENPADTMRKALEAEAAEQHRRTVEAEEQAAAGLDTAQQLEASQATDPGPVAVTRPDDPSYVEPAADAVIPAHVPPLAVSVPFSTGGDGESGGSGGQTSAESGEGE